MKILNTARSYIRYLIAARWLDIQVYVALTAGISLLLLFAVAGREFCPTWLGVTLVLTALISWLGLIAGAIIHHLERRL